MITRAIIFSSTLLLLSHLLFPFVIGEPLTYGWLISKQGWIPHLDYVDQHTQGLPLLIALVTLLTKNTDLSARIIFLAFPIATAGLLSWAASWLFVDKRAVFLTPLIFTLWYIMWAKNTSWFHNPIVFLAPLSILLLHQDLGVTPKSWAMIFSGLAFGAALLFKQTAIVFLPIILLVLLSRRKYLEFAIWNLAFLTPILLYLLFFWMHGALPELFQQEFVEARVLQTYNQEYFGLYIAPPRWSTLLQLTLLFILIPSVLQIISLARQNFQFPLLARELARSELFNFQMFMLLSALAAMTFSYPQLTLQHASLATPFLALLTTGFLFNNKTIKQLNNGKKWLLLGIIGVITILPQSQRTIDALLRGSPQTSTYAQVVETIQRLTRADERIVICCGEPRYYYDAQRVPATKFLFFSELAGALDWDRKMTEELNTNRPQHIVYSPTFFDIASKDPSIYGEDFAEKKKTASAFLPQFEEELSRSYQPMTTISPTIKIYQQL